MERRDRKPFEPPPWERPAELRHRQEPEQQPPERERQDEEERARCDNAAPAGSQPLRPGAREIESGEAQPKAELDRARLEEMLAQLRAEEPPVTSRQAWAVGIGAAAVSMLIGLVMFVWGVAATRTVMEGSRSVGGLFGAGVVLLFALLFLSAGGWLLWRSLKQRGDI